MGIRCTDCLGPVAVGGNNQTDPYADLQAALKQRKANYLATITSTDPTQGSAITRGYLKSETPTRQTFTRSDKRGALGTTFTDVPTTTWFDSWPLRAIWNDLIWPEDIYSVSARLFVAGKAFSPNVAAELPPLDAQATFQEILFAVDWVTICSGPTGSLGKTALELKIWDTIAAAKDHSGNQLFAQSVIDAILDALEAGPPSDLSPDELVIPWLAEFTAGGQKVGEDEAGRCFASVAGLIGGSATTLFIETALSDGRTTPSWTPTGLIGNEDDDLNLSDDVWAVFQFLRFLAGLPLKSLREALIALANWVLPAIPAVTKTVSPINPPPLKLQDIAGGGAEPETDIFTLIWSNRVFLPTEFIWPSYDPPSLYWWRSVVLPTCVQHLFARADTSDFHSLALTRFGSLFHLYDPDPSNRDARVPDWVAADIKLSLLKFKYWLDEAPATGNDGGEMTFWSENHQIQFATSEYIAGCLFSSSEKFDYDPDNVKTGTDRQARGKARVDAWLTHRLSFGFSEWNAPGYYDEDMPSLFTLVDFAPDPEIRTKAQMVLDTLVFDFARLSCRGSFGVSAGRAYWEHKCYGWQQSIGDMVEVLFGQRGDVIGTSSQSAVAFATSTYEVPDVLLAIAIDRPIVDPSAPQFSRTRVSMFRSEAADNGVDPAKDDNLIFWWGNMDYFGTETLDLTDQFSGNHDNLKLTPPFNILYKFIHLSDDEWHQVLYDTLETAAGVAATSTEGALAVVLPFPLDLVAIAAQPASIGLAVEGIIHLLGDIVSLIAKGLHAIAHFLGLAGDDPPKIPESAIVAAFHKLLYAFNDGNVLQRANLCHYSNGDVALSSLQNHLPGQMCFQKQAWQATLGMEACIWTTAPFRSAGAGSKARAWFDFFADYLTFNVVQGIETAALTFIDAGSIFGHDGYTYWNGSMALPLIVQYRSAAIIAYQFNDIEKRLSDPATHAWFPKAMFDTTVLFNANGGTWVFGQKDAGYVALFSAQPMTWQTQGPWTDKELVADGSANIFVCFVGNQTKFGSFDAFTQQTKNAYLHMSGIGGPVGLECSFDIPGESAPSGNAPRLELFYGDLRGRFAGSDLDLNNFARWETPYASVPWGARSYTMSHSGTGLSLTHDLDHVLRSFNRQPVPQTTPQPIPRRLSDGSVTAVRRFQTPPQPAPMGAQLRRQLFGG
jgi:hypothetical protein